MVVIERCLETTSRFHLQSAAERLKTLPISCPKTSLNNYQSRLRNISEELKIQRLVRFDFPTAMNMWETHLNLTDMHQTFVS